MVPLPASDATLQLLAKVAFSTPGALTVSAVPAGMGCPPKVPRFQVPPVMLVAPV